VFTEQTCLHLLLPDQGLLRGSTELVSIWIEAVDTFWVPCLMSCHLHRPLEGPGRVLLHPLAESPQTLPPRLSE